MLDQHEVRKSEESGVHDNARAPATRHVGKRCFIVCIAFEFQQWIVHNTAQASCLALTKASDRRLASALRREQEISHPNRIDVVPVAPTDDTRCPYARQNKRSAVPRRGHGLTHHTTNTISDDDMAQYGLSMSTAGDADKPGASDDASQELEKPCSHGRDHGRLRREHVEGLPHGIHEGRCVALHCSWIVQSWSIGAVAVQTLAAGFLDRKHVAGCSAEPDLAAWLQGGNAVDTWFVEPLHLIFPEPTFARADTGAKLHHTQCAT